MQLISENLNNQLNNLIGKSFSINRMLDRGMSLLGVRWKLINSAKNLHPKVSHAYPSSKFADGIQDYQASREAETIYPATPIGNREYQNPLEFFIDFYKENLEFENMIKDVIDMSIEEGDNNTKNYLDKLLDNLVPFTALSQTLIDLVTQYGNETFKLQLFDSVIEKYIEV